MTTPQQPGWYDDPNAPNAQRYWDGQEWTPHRRRTPTAAPASPPAQPPQQAPAQPAPTPLHQARTQPAPLPQQQTPPPPQHQAPTQQAPVSLPPPPPPTQPAPSNLPPPPPPDLPPPPPGNAPPPPPTDAPRGKVRVSKVALVLAGLALVLAIAAVVAGRVELGSFLPGIGLVAAIGLIAGFFAIRSHQSVAQKAIVVTAVVLVVAAAIPASLKVVYPVYNHFFPQKSTQASHGRTAGPGAGTAGPDAGPGAPSGGTGPGAPSSDTGAGTPKSGILVMSGDGWDKAEFGYVDPSTGKYTHVSSFSLKEPGDPAALEMSPDLTKYATLKADTSAGGAPGSAPVRAGWIDSSGKFTAVSPAAPPASDFERSQPPAYSSPVFDGAGNFYYWSTQEGKSHLYKLPAGSTSNPQEVTPTPKGTPGTVPFRNFDGSLNFGCNPVPGTWLGPDSRMLVLPITDSSGLSTNHYAVFKLPVTTAADGCPSVDQFQHEDQTKVFDLGIQTVDQPVANPDHTKIAFFNSNTPGGLYVVDVGGDGKPKKIASRSDLNFGNMKLVRWN
jgi:Protein of unknown function (DUF2510)